MCKDRIAVVLPPREAFSPLAAGAIGLLAHRLVVQPSAFVPVVYGPEVAAPFTDVTFRPVRPAWILASQAIRYAAALGRRLRRDPPALVEVHNRPDVALFLAARLPVPVMLVLHNDPQGMRCARTAQERHALLDRLACVATVSEFLRARLLAGVEVPPRGPVVVPNCIDFAVIPPAGPREDLLLFTGRVVADKGADVFVAACARALPHLPGWRAAMIGADRFGPDSPETPFLRDLRPRAAAAGVTLHGYLPHDAVLAALVRAGIAVMPSRWQEPFGLAALEALACGAPLLCSMRGGLAEVARGAALPVDPDDPAELAGAMLALARDPDRRAALSAAGRARAAAFDAPLAASRLDALRRDVLAAWSPGAPRPI
ncbi:Glycosyltransferase family 4 protein [Rhodovastum atsumiense]|uniref:Glycosyltransferase family 4 protein n=1 Tax=Rhodovastum atsumiense TaxID=504468 RepID=A0A5M6IMR9_9PROT|nr:glycosyltransferase family 4 protein [Rhodovastum atsumiense]KAA5609159.1 glycosyltransferase family 4 protein [Rhodovastum atsumiense]CAH2601229.1 Glycosyltransferase family 4 protein [Rhodovastum atsumiense]